MTEYIYQSHGEPLVNERGEIYLARAGEIVRCRDCKHHVLMTVSYLDKPLSVCISEQWIGAEGDNPLVKSNGFCAWAERKEGIEQ